MQSLDTAAYVGDMINGRFIRQNKSDIAKYTASQKQQEQPDKTYIFTQHNSAQFPPATTTATLYTAVDWKLDTE